MSVHAPVLRVKGRDVVVDGTLVMGVVNTSPESFSDGGRHASLDHQLRHCEAVVAAGADIVDVGGQSAVTNQPELDAGTELERVLPVVEWLVARHPGVLVSVDTYKPAVVEAVLAAGAAIVNDVSGRAEPEVVDACVRHEAALVVMHTAAAPKVRLQRADLYRDVAGEVVRFLADRTALAVERGLPRESVVVDPGPDFTKTPHQTLALLRRMDEVRALGRPVLLALSRKDFLGAITGRRPRGRDAATAAAIGFFAATPGNIVRVHDVAAAKDVVATVEALTGRRELDPGYLLPDSLRYEPAGSGVNESARAWYRRRTTSAERWPAAEVLARKGNRRISVVIPARDEEATVADVVAMVRRDLVDDVRLVDELVVMDSLSGDATAERARAAGARVWSVADVVPELGVRPGKGEALWKSLFVTTGDVLVFVDADLSGWGTHFVTGLLGPILADDGVRLVRGFYDRLLDFGHGVSVEGGRVTELVARPLLALHWPELSAVVQPLAGEWAIRRDLAERLPFPVGYGVELATLLDTARLHGTDAVAQVDLGQRAHRHQTLHDLGAMATEILHVAAGRLGIEPAAGVPDVVLPRLDHERRWEERAVPTLERPPASTVPAYRARAGDVRVRPAPTARSGCPQGR